MASYQVTTGLLGAGLALLIIYLLRRDHLYVIHGLFWIAVAGLALVLGFWPGLIDRLASLVGISYAPSLIFLLAVIVLMVKALHSDLSYTKLKRQIRMLNQRVAVLDAKQPTSMNHSSLLQRKSCPDSV